MTEPGLRRHIKIAGYLHICLGAVISIFATLVLFETLQTKGWGLLVTIVASKLLIVFGLFDVVVGTGFVTGTRAAWILLWPVSIILLPVVPVGTGIALYSFWILIMSRKLFFLPFENLSKD